MITPVVTYSVVDHRSSQSTLEDALKALQEVSSEAIEKCIDKGEPLIQKHIRFKNDLGTCFSDLESAIRSDWASDAELDAAVYIIENSRWLGPLLTEYGQ